MRTFNANPGAAAVTFAVASVCLTACAEGYTSNSYAVAGAFAAAAGAMQIAESASPQPSIGSCDTQTCNGCCDRSGACHTGDEVAVCGQAGLACVDCTLGGLYCNTMGFCEWDGGR